MMNKLIFRYLQKNKKKACGEILSVAIAIAFMFFICNSSVWYYSFMKNVEIELNGSWHVRYYDLDAEQVTHLKAVEEIHDVSTHKIENLYNTDVEFEKVDKEIFKKAEEICEFIGMKKLEKIEEEYMPNGEQKIYDISFHMELLDFYGITYENSQASIKTYFLSVLVIVTLIFAIFIYNIFQLSYNDKRKYLGILRCVGVSANQRRYFVLGEEVFTGGIGIAIGLLSGTLGSYGILPKVENILMRKAEIYAKHIQYLDVRILLSVFGLGCILIFISSIVPIIRAGKESPLQIAKIKEEKSICDYSFKTYRSVESNLALKNFFRDGKRTFIMIFLPALITILALNGYVYIKMQNGDYLLKDRREKKALSSWVTLSTWKFDDVERMYREILEEKEFKDIQVESILNLGVVLVDKKFIQEDFEKFMLYGMLGENPVNYVNSQKVDKELYGYNAKIIGVDESSFLKYASKCGIDTENFENATYPVIIEDYLPIKSDESISYKSTLNIKNGSTMTVAFGKYGDAILLEDQVYLSEKNSVKLDVMGVSDEVYLCPETPDEYATKLDTYSQINDSYINIYMTYETFKMFVSDGQVKNAYGKMPQNVNPIMWREENLIETYLFFSSELKEEKELEILTNYFVSQNIRRYDEVDEGNYKASDIYWSYGNVDRIEKERFQHPEKLLKKLFVIGAFIFVMIFIMSAWIDYLLKDSGAKKGEYIILKSIGMNKIQISKMIIIESTVLLFVSIIVGNVIGYAFVAMMFYEYSHSVACEIIFPWKFTIMEMVAMLLFVILINIFNVRAMQKLNIVEQLKTVN